LADPNIYTESEKENLKKLMERKVQVDKALDDAEAAWMDAEEQIEAIR
jgi:ATP-binding cassette subfamily F protein 3